MSDIDLIIVGEEDGQLDQKLINLLQYSSDIDAIYISKNSLANSSYKGIKNGGVYELHAFDIYRITINGKVIFGNQEILNLFPKVDISKALMGTLPHVKDKFIPLIIGQLEDKEIDEISEEMLNYLLVIIRDIYSVETEAYGSKIKAIQYLKRTKPEYTNLADAVENLYLNKNQKIEKI